QYKILHFHAHRSPHRECYLIESLSENAITANSPNFVDLLINSLNQALVMPINQILIFRRLRIAISLNLAKPICRAPLSEGVHSIFSPLPTLRRFRKFSL